MNTEKVTLEFVKLINKTLMQVLYHLIKFPKSLTDWPRVHAIYLQKKQDMKDFNRQQFRKEVREQRLKRQIAQLQGIRRGAWDRKLM